MLKRVTAKVHRMQLCVDGDRVSLPNGWSVPFELSTYNASVRTYPDGSMKVRFFSDRSPVSWDYVEDELDDVSPPDTARSKYSAVGRARNVVFDLARANDWDWFITLTLDKEKIDRYDYPAITVRLQTFIKYLRRHGCQWLIVPELHGDGAYHFHGLLSGQIPLNLGPIKTTKKGEPYQSYNIPAYKLGFSDVSAVRDRSRVSAYVTKYMTKALLETVPPGRKRYWASRGLQVPEKKRLYLTSDEVQIFQKAAQYISTCADPLGNEIVTLII